MCSAWSGVLLLRKSRRTDAGGRTAEGTSRCGCLPACPPLPPGMMAARRGRCALVLGVRMGKLRQKSSARNCPNQGDLGMPGSGEMLTSGACGPSCPLPVRLGCPAASGDLGPGASVFDPSRVLAEGVWATCVREAGNVPVPQTLSQGPSGSGGGPDTPAEQASAVGISSVSPSASWRLPGGCAAFGHYMWPPLEF